jgi:2-C-methyl-D-erythritol 4-phosphate cytidylyltransferase/2-C-methyl-D-erythritol 2,4-cyclodiphosphate synthase
MSKKKPNIAVLIVAAGRGSRMESNIPKQYMTINGKTILRHTVDIFANIPEIKSIQCVISSDDMAFYQQAVDGLDILPPVNGGASRQDSVFNGLKALKRHNPDIVLIHDAARPCVNSQDIQRLIHSFESYKSATLAMPVTETLMRGHDVIPRDDTWIIQTPQGFHYDTILLAHERALADGYQGTDDCSLTTHYGIHTHYVPCGRHNIKITTQDDLTMAEKLLNSTMETRVGTGFDVHAFDAGAAHSIRLCGIDIAYTRSLSGHSDADVGLHALTDAVFGALAEGDIGTHFPPSDETFKNMDSHVFLDKSVDMLRARGGQIRHIDITFICEEPKISKNQTAMRDHLAHHLNLSTHRISIKATTTEKLGFTGRGEGIACQATVTIGVPRHD